MFHPQRRRTENEKVENVWRRRSIWSKEDRKNGAEECHFIGHLAKEQDACVAMTGCVGSEDIDFTIMSSHATKSAMFKWSKDGHVEIIESPFKVKNHT